VIVSFRGRRAESSLVGHHQDGRVFIFAEAVPRDYLPLPSPVCIDKPGVDNQP
jgi:hypothetical protein